MSSHFRSWWCSNTVENFGTPLIFNPLNPIVMTESFVIIGNRIWEVLVLSLNICPLLLNKLTFYEKIIVTFPLPSGSIWTPSLQCVLFFPNLLHELFQHKLANYWVLSLKLQFYLHFQRERGSPNNIFGVWMSQN